MIIPRNDSRAMHPVLHPSPHEHAGMGMWRQEKNGDGRLELNQSKNTSTSLVQDITEWPRSIL